MGKKKPKKVVKPIVSKSVVSSTPKIEPASKKSTQIQLSRGTLVRLRELLFEYDAQEIQQIESNNHSKEKQLSEWSLIYDKLIVLGFQHEQISKGFHKIHQISCEGFLDWACLQLESDELPQKFSIGALGAADQEAQVMLATQPQLQQQTQSEIQLTEEELKQKQIESELQLAKQKEQQEQERREREEARQKEQQDMKLRVLQYMEEEQEQSDDACDQDDDDDLDPTLQIWSDQREIERRKRQRSLSKMSTSERRLQTAREYFGAKKLASEAKQLGDKQKQKQAGAMIAQLKQEMSQLGMSEQDVELELQGPSRQEENIDNDVSELDADADEVFDQDQQLFDEQEEEGMGMFDENVTPPEWEADILEGIEKKLAMQKQEQTMPWAYSGESTTSKKKNSDQKVSKPTQLVEPRALLQSHCHNKGWPAPKFKRITSPVGSYRYSVTLEMKAGFGPKSKRVQVVTHILESSVEGFESVNLAQNMAACWALFSMQLEDDVISQLHENYREHWLEWAQERSQQVDQGSSSGSQLVANKIKFLEQIYSMRCEISNQKIPLSARDIDPPELQNTAYTSDSDAAVQQDTSIANDERISNDLYKKYQDWQQSQQGQSWEQKRSVLPAREIREQILSCLQHNDIMVVSGDTGCGKSTQVPQYLLEDMIVQKKGCKAGIICTQPRRIAAISLAERVANEMGQPAPGQRGSLVGYHVRLKAAVTKSTKLTFCTTGILLRRLAGDPQLGDVSHVVVDEVHERATQSDFLMALLRNLVNVRQQSGNPLKVVLMSATLDADLFSSYYDQCPVLNAKGRTFPVQSYFLEDVYEITNYHLEEDSPAAYQRKGAYQNKRNIVKSAGGEKAARLLQEGWGDDEYDQEAMNPKYSPHLYPGKSDQTHRNLGRLNEDRIDFDVIECLIEYIDDNNGEGAILVFLPGMGEIVNLLNRIQSGSKFRQGRYFVVPLHSTISPVAQKDAFIVPGAGVRKIVLSTNIAETSLTIEDVSYVIDTGRGKERRYDAGRGMASLVEDWVSKASAKQRRGRAGRVREGYCFATFTSQCFDNTMRPFQIPEIARVPLEELVLQIHLLKLDPAAAFLSQLIQPPKDHAIQTAISRLVEVGALYPVQPFSQQQEKLTALGRHIAQLPVDAHIGKLLVFSAIIGALKPALTLAACLADRSPFQTAFDQQDNIKFAKEELLLQQFGGGDVQSDHLVLIAAYDGWVSAQKKGRGAARDYCRRYCLSQQTLEMLRDMRKQFAEMLLEVGLVFNGNRDGERDSWFDDPEMTWNQFSNDVPVIRALLCSAMYPNVAMISPKQNPQQIPTFVNKDSQILTVHPQSMLAKITTAKFNTSYLVFLEKVKTSKLFIRDCSTVSPLPLILFCGSKMQIFHEFHLVIIDDWIQIKLAPQIAVLVKQLRVALDQLLQSKYGQGRNEGGANLKEKSKEILKIMAMLLRDEASLSAYLQG